MPAEYKTPGVYIEEIPHLPPSIASVETAIPAFIGYTERAQEKQPGDLKNVPFRIESMLEYQQYFGGAFPEKSITVTVDTSQANKTDIQAKANPPQYLMYYSLQLFFANGGGPCYIVSVGDYSGGGVILEPDLETGLGTLPKIKEITLIVFPDAVNLTAAAAFYKLHQAAIQQCVDLQNRFTILDVFRDPASGRWQDDVDALRNTLSGDTEVLKYAGVYFPRINTGVTYSYQVVGTHTDNDALVKIVSVGGGDFGATLADLKSKNNSFYFLAKNAIDNLNMLLPAAPAMAGIYAQVDAARGVWKAPANVNISNAISPEILITDQEQENLNVDTTAGKSINAIRSFPGRGPAIVWGARTLAGNDNEWRYISVRRFFIMVEQSTKNAVEQFVFEPNDENTWVRIKSMIQNYLTQQWKAGALMGASTKEAFFVHIGLGQTMTEVDIWEGRLIIEIGLAAVRPAEFIILRFMHKMLAES